MEKVESLEQAAREFFDLHWDAIRPDAKISRDAFDFAAAFAKKKTAERERQVWAEAAKAICNDCASGDTATVEEGFWWHRYNTHRARRCSAGLIFRARGEQVK